MIWQPLGRALAFAWMPALLAAPVAAVQLPVDFVAENAVPGQTFTTPTAIAFLPGGRMLVTEKRGRVYSVMNGVKNPTPMLSIDAEVLNQQDRGLLGLAVDPNYVTNRYVYLLYTVDPDSDNVETNSDGFGRLARYQVSAADSNVLAPASRAILMGVTWTQGPVAASPSHTVGCLRFGTDGSLLVSVGDGAHFEYMDAGGNDAAAFGKNKTDPYEDIGSFRAQSLKSLCGKILRINPANGMGYMSNPYHDGNLGSIRSRVWAYGVRNPFRFTLRPNTGSTDTTAGNPGTLYIGDVGYNTWEEMNVVPAGGGVNFGWPCYEGIGGNTEYQGATPAHNGCDSFGTPDNPTQRTSPLATWHHSNPNLSTPPGFFGNCSIGGVFYTGTLYPLEYRNRYFFADYGQSWIKTAVLDNNNNLTQLLGFSDSGANGPVDFALEPGTRNLIYIAVSAGEVRRIRYTGPSANGPPTAVASAAPTVGVVPLTVNFSSAGSSDPESDPLTFSWNFGDSQGSTQANPQHTYTTAGTYPVILTADDGQGNIGRDTVTVIVTVSSKFPLTAVLDDFNRPDGPLGTPWVDPVNGLAGLSILGNALQQTCCFGTPVWGATAFGPDQEAYVTLTAITPSAPEQDLMLKLQSPSYAAAHVQVRYDAAQGRVVVSTYTPGVGWASIGAPIAATFSAGDQLGARAYSNGAVDVYQNGVKIGGANASTWPYASQGGWIGLTLSGALTSRFDNFGGGTVVVSGNTPPTCAVTAPPESSFFVAGSSVDVAAAASDAEQSAATLIYEWSVDLHHNNHLHPGAFFMSGPTASFVPELHDDGTGMWYEIVLTVTDNGGLSDTARCNIFPEIDLAPSWIYSNPSLPGTTDPCTYSFWIYNHGRMPSPLMRWRLVAGATMLVEGDTLVAANDSVRIARTLPPMLPPGNYTVRVKVDTLGTVWETNEGNNAMARALTVVSGPGTVDVSEPPPRELALSGPRPNPTRGRVSFALDLPRAAAVDYAVYDVQGREVWRAPAKEYGAGRWNLQWPGEARGARPVPAGLYLAAVRVDGRLMVRRFALVR